MVVWLTTLAVSAQNESLNIRKATGNLVNTQGLITIPPRVLLESNLFFRHRAFVASSQVTNFIWDLNVKSWTNLAANSIHLQQTTNRASSSLGPSRIRIVVGNTNRHFSVNSNWRPVMGSRVPTLLVSNRVYYIEGGAYGDSESLMEFAMWSSDGTNNMSDSDVLYEINQAVFTGTNNAMASVAQLYASLAAQNTFTGAINTFNRIYGIQSGVTGGLNTNLFLQNTAAGNVRVSAIYDNGTYQTRQTLFSTNFLSSDVYRNAFTVDNAMGPIYFFGHSAIALPNYQMGVLSNRVTIHGLAIGNALDGLAPGGVLTNMLFASGTLDFDSTTVGAIQDKGIAVAGCKDGDSVTVAPPQGSITGIIGSYSGFASNGVAFVRFTPTGTAQDPASGTFRVEVRAFR